jgi:hypothetical protein
MTSRVLPFIAAFGFVAASLVAGCSGGGGGPVSGGSATPTPGASALAVTTRPLQNGDTFSYAGTTLQTFVFSGTTPEPESTTLYAVAQSIAVSGPTTYAGTSNVFDLTDTETDTSPLQTIGITTQTYYALLTTSTGSNLVTYGFTSTDTNGESLAVTIPNVGSGNGLLDELPEKSGQSWTNGAAQVANETSPGGITSGRTVQADGSYADKTNFPIGSIYASPVPGSPLVNAAIITENSDGSGSYVFDAIVTAGGQPENVEELDFSTPVPASSGVPASIAISEPQPSASPLVVTIPVWYPQPLKLYTETDVDDGAVSLPPSCAVPSSLGTAADAVVQSIVSYDTIVGTAETLSQTNYVVPNYGLACVVLGEKLQYYYDYSGQTNLFALVPNANVTATATYPIETETIATTLGLTQTSVTAAARSGASVARSGTLATGLRITNARSNLLAFAAREKLRHKILLLRKFRTVLFERDRR